MKKEDKDKVSTWLTRLRNRPVIAAIVVLGVTAIALANFTTAMTSSWKAISELFDRDQEPEILQFALDPSKSSFYEIDAPKFGAGPKIKTFTIDPSFLGVIRTGRAIFQVSLENPNDKNMVLTDVIYNVSELGDVKGGVAGPLNSKQSYFHKLEYKVGQQKTQLVPPFVIPPKSVGAFTLELYSNDPRPGLTWVMDIDFISNRGRVSTDTFQLVLTGKNHKSESGYH